MRKTCILVPLLLLFHLVCEAMILIYSRSPKSWQKAQAYCRQYYTDLVTIRDAAENDFVSGRGWIGLYRKGSQWRWSSGAEKANFTMWKDGEPHHDKNCALKSSGQNKWHSDGCSKQKHYICYDERLVLVNENKTWEGALKHCRALGRATAYQNHRYDLASLHTEDDHVSAQRAAERATTDEVWVGLRYLAGWWLWLDGGKVQRGHAQSCTAHWHCGTLWKDGTTPYGTTNCKEKKNFLCYKKE